jgi:hypothetical protein
VTAENIELKKRVAELEEKLDQRAKVFFYDNAYWIGQKTPNVITKEDGPFCAACYDPQRLVRLREGNVVGVAVFSCPEKK